MPIAPHVATMQDIANAIREKSTGAGATGPIPVSRFAERIKTIPRPATDLVRQFAAFATEQTPAQMTSQRLIRCNGMPAYEVPSTVIYDALKRDDWMPVDFPPPPIGPIPTRQYHRFFEDGDNLYLCFTTANATTLNVINTRTGVFTEITGLLSRQYRADAFFIAGNNIYVHAMGTSVNTIVRIHRTTFAHSTVTLDTARQYNTCALLGHRLFFGWSGTVVATVLPFINTNVDPPTAGTVTGLPSRAHNTLFAVPESHKLFVAGPAATEITVITAGTAAQAPNYTTWTVSNITGLPSRIYGTSGTWFLAGNFLYIGQGNTDETSIIRIQHTTAANTTTQVTGLPSRRHNIFRLVGTKIYLGSTTASTDVLVINNTTGAILTTITGLPSRSYSAMEVVGNKLYMGARSLVTTLPVINTTNDTWSEMTGFSISGGGYIDSFVQVGTLLVVINGWGFQNGSVVINTDNDTIRNWIGGFSGLGDAAHLWPVRITLVDRVDGQILQDELFYGRWDRNNNIAVLDLLALQKLSSGTSINVRVIGGLAFRASQHIVVKNDKIWMTGATTADNGNAHNTNGINLLTKAVLPNHPQPVYIRY